MHCILLGRLVTRNPVLVLTMLDDTHAYCAWSVAQAGAESASPGGRLPFEVLAMCGVGAPLRHLDLTRPAETLSRLDDIECPIEGISCLQARLNCTPAALLERTAGHC